MLTRWLDLPLRLRLTLLYVGLLFILLIALGSVLYLETRNFMISTTSLRLEALANTSISRLGPPPEQHNAPQSLNGRAPFTSTVSFEPMPFDRVAPILARDLTWQDYFALVLDNTGTRLADGTALISQTVSIPAPDANVLTRALNGERVTYTTPINGKDALAILIPVHYPTPDSPIVGVVQMIASLDVIDQVMESQRVLILISVFVTLLLATAGGLWLTHTALTPLRLMIDTCRRIAAGDLSQRVNLPQRRDETGQLAAAFDEMVEQLDHAFTTQRQFIADASHELRTPLTALGGSLEVLLLAPEGDPAMARRVLHNMRREVERLTRLVTDLLTLTRLDARRSMKIQNVDLAILGREVIESIKPLTQNRTVTLEASGATQCRGDADQLKQVFYNLIGNAIHATDPDRGSIVVRAQGGEDKIRIEVSDNGNGIPDQAKAHVFERFYRLDQARARANGGSGLGLAIVQAIVQAHGGVIEPVESEIGKGTRIRFMLPRGG